MPDRGFRLLADGATRVVVPALTAVRRRRGSRRRVRGGKWSLRASLSAIGLALATSPAAAQVGAYSPAQGSPERKAIVNTLRLPVSRMLKGPVAFAVSHLKVHRKWALLIAVPRRPTGEAIDYADTKWAEAVRSQEFKDEIVALLRQRGTRWRVVWYVIGATEPPWRGWAKRYGAPPEIFPKIEDRSGIR